MKKTLSLVLALLMLCCFSAPSALAVNVVLNSSLLSFPDQEPVLENGSVLVPIRPVAEALGLGVGWDESSQKVTLMRNSFFIELTIGSNKAVTHSGIKTLGSAPKIINGRTMVPLRFIAEALGLTVLWNGQYQRVVINGKIDSQSAPPKKEQPSESSSEAGSTDEVIASQLPTEFEEETEPQNDSSLLTLSAPSSTLTFEIPASFAYEDTADEQSFAFRTIDASDLEHLYKWDTVTQYESYADSDAKNGIVIIVQELEPVESGDVDVSRINETYPEPPENPEIDWKSVFNDMSLVACENLCSERGIEMPENFSEMTEDEQAATLGFATTEEYAEYLQAAFTELDRDQFPAFAEQEEYMQLLSEYMNQVRELDRIKNTAFRSFSSLASSASDEEWSAFFSDRLNTDPEVRFDSVEILTINDKKIVHCTMYAEDPDDEQGTFDYYRYFDGDTQITILGGTLFEGEASPEAVDVLSRMNIN